MFTIAPYGEASVRQQLGSLMTGNGVCLPPLTDDAALPPADARPLVQLSHSEIAEEQMERALGHQICASNCPIGLPGSASNQQVASDLLLFSLRDLDGSLRKVAPELASEYDTRGTDAIMASREVTAFEYLVLGLLRCIAWCESRQAALMIRW